MVTKQEALSRFESILDAQAARVERIKSDTSSIDYAATKPIIIGILGGDGIGPFIAEEAQRVLEILLKDEVASGKVDFRVLEGLTIENRAAHLKAASASRKPRKRMSARGRWRGRCGILARV